ncbi:hypothetical protein EDB80DRAFT_712335 [Ilyonectria destructans]|nr:hypothetical protein EDB80DRAFT_712335 [Ilyonectria destructans]
MVQWGLLVLTQLSRGSASPHSTRTKATLGLACMRMQWMDARMYVRLQLRWDRVSSPTPCLEIDLGVLRGLRGLRGLRCVAPGGQARSLGAGKWIHWLGH